MKFDTARAVRGALQATLVAALLAWPQSAVSSLFASDLPAGVPPAAIGPGRQAETSDFSRGVWEGRRFEGCLLSSAFSGGNRLSGPKVNSRPHQGIDERCGDPVVNGADGIEHAVDTAQASTTPIKNHQDKIIELTADGVIHLDGASVSKDEFISRVAALPPDTSFLIRADRNLIYEKLLEVCAILTRLNFSWTIQVQSGPK